MQEYIVMPTFIAVELIKEVSTLQILIYPIDWFDRKLQISLYWFSCIAQGHKEWSNLSVGSRLTTYNKLIVLHICSILVMGTVDWYSL